MLCWTYLVQSVVQHSALRLYSYFKDSHLAVVKSSPILAKLLNTLLPFSLIRNHVAETCHVSK